MFFLTESICTKHNVDNDIIIFTNKDICLPLDWDISFDLFFVDYI